MQRTLPMGIILFSSSVIAQVISMAIMPRTFGFTNLPYTLACLVSMDLSVWLAARLLQRGASLGVMIPAMAAFVPLVTILIEICMYGESPSTAKVSLLVVACGLVAFASALP